MHDTVQTASPAAQVSTKIAASILISRRKSDDQPDVEIEYETQEYERKRSRTFSHVTKDMLHKRTLGAWAERCFVAQFALPTRHLSDDRVLGLKSYHVTRWSLYGAIVVRSTTADRGRVCVRYTLDEWKTHIDVEARFLSVDNANGEEVFQFRLDFPFRLQHGTRLQMAVAYEALSESRTYWDNNDGANYVFSYRFSQRA